MLEAYNSTINRAIDYIDSNLENPLTLDELASAANVSKFHFNRIFHAVVGETPFQFILRLRLEKAASMIRMGRKATITEIAYRCGFSDMSIFSRNFRRHFHVAPSKFRQERSQISNLSQPKSNLEQNEQELTLYFSPRLQTINWRTTMDLLKSIEVKELPGMTVVYVRNMGPWNGNKEEYLALRNKLFSWAGARGLIGGNDVKYLILYHDDPNVALTDKLRMSLCLSVPSSTKVDGEVGKMEIEAGKYAIARFELTSSDFQKAWEWLYGNWLPNSGYQLADRPYYETYPEEPQGEKFMVDFCIPVSTID